MNRIALGASPIAWCNDDLPALGGDTPLTTCLREMQRAGYRGTETSGRFPLDPDILAPLLAGYGLKLVSGWYTGGLLEHDLAEECARIDRQLDTFAALSAPVIVYGEMTGTVQNRPDRPLTDRPRLTDDAIAAYGAKLTALGAYCTRRGVGLAYHPHMGAVIETAEEIDRLMAATGPEVGLLFDSGHLVFAGADPLAVLDRHGARVVHVHAKDVRAEILAGLDRRRQSFLDAVLAGVFTVPGDGSIDFAAIATRLAALGYGGWLVVEAEQDPARADPYQYACRGHQALVEAFTAAGYVFD